MNKHSNLNVYFWRAFAKRASIIEDWQEESDKEGRKEPELDKDVDPSTLGLSITPDIHWRSWP